MRSAAAGAAAGTAAAALVVAAVLVAGPGGPTHRPPPPSASSQQPPYRGPAWRLTASLSAPAFQLGTGSPTSAVGATCGPGGTCLLSTAYGLDYGGGGGMNVSHDGGHTWAQAALPRHVATTTLASCVSATWCAAGGGLLDLATGDPAAGKPLRDPMLLVSTDGGTVWTATPVPVPASVTHLPAYGRFPAETTTWPGEIDDISCHAPGVCDLLAQTQDGGNPALGRPGATGDSLVFLRTEDGGRTWATTVIPELPDEVDQGLVLQPGSSESMACPTDSECVVLATFGIGNLVDAWRTTDAGKTWTEHRLKNVGTVTPDLNCPDATTCWAGPVGYGNGPAGWTLIRSTDGGATWNPVPVALPPATNTDAAAGGQPWIACTTAASCYYGNDVGLNQTTDGGRTWLPVPLPPGVAGTTQISCDPATGSCIAVAGPPNPTPHIHGPPRGSLIVTDAPSP